jgi:hypothetical protein
VYLEIKPQFSIIDIHQETNLQKFCIFVFFNQFHKSKQTAIMTKFDQSILTYKTFMADKLGDTNVHDALLIQIAEELGTAIFDADASLVACSDKAELSRVKQYFLLGRLGLSDTPALDEAIKSVCTTMGTSNRKKFRVVFYYLLVKYFNADATVLTPIDANLY